MKIIAFHLLNDYSGSPKVLRQLAKIWCENGLDVHLVTCSGRQGFLSNIAGVRYHFFFYRLAGNALSKLFYFLYSQFILFWKVLFLAGRQDILYINTVLPFGAGLAGKLKGCKVIYHIHETSIKPLLLKRFLFACVRWCATEIVYVSRYLAEQEPIKNKTHILYNAIEEDFLQTAKKNRKISPNPQNVLMVCSLKTYKGVREFARLAELNPHFCFRLVLNASPTEIDAFFASSSLPTCLEILPTQTDLHPHYAWADVVLNLSLPDAWIETFGLTIIEGMAYGLPAIVPPVGGIAELVAAGENGFQCDARDIFALSLQLNALLTNQALYTAMSTAASLRIELYNEANFSKQALQIVRNATPFFGKNKLLTFPRC